MEKSVLVLVIYQAPTFNKTEKKKQKMKEAKRGMLKWQIFSWLLWKECNMPDAC